MVPEPLVGAADGELHAIGGFFDFVGFGFDVDFDAALLEKAFEEDRAIFVFDREKMIEQFDDLDFGSHRAVEVGELAADRAGADDGDFLGLLGEVHGLAGGDDFYAVDVDAWECAGASAGADEDVLGGEFLRSFFAGDFHFVERSDLAGAGFALHFVFAEEVGDSLGEFVGNSARTRYYL